MLNLFRPSLNDGEIKLKFVAKHNDSNPNGWGLSYIYDIIEIKKNRIVGRCDIRVGEGDTIELAGHIGYTIYKPYRGHRYATKATLLLFKQAQILGMKELIITCNSDNLASFKTCQFAGCEFVGLRTVPVDHELYLQGDREKAIFIKKIESKD